MAHDRQIVVLPPLSRGGTGRYHVSDLPVGPRIAPLFGFGELARQRPYALLGHVLFSKAVTHG